MITSRDHFVALPSRRMLASNGGREHQVRVCNPRNGRCETAPVWDVGPWNTKDDYWNPSSVRQMWQDLPQGVPQAQAAYENGYNGGRDEFGRRVGNPAGIDLADGTFWDALGMSGNDWVDVKFTDAAFTANAVAGKCLDARSDTAGENDGAVALWDCWGGKNQQWHWEGDRIRNVVAGKCLDAWGDTAGDNGGTVALWDCWGGKNQQWYRDGNQIRNAVAGKCLDARADTADQNGGGLMLWDCWGGPNQQWS